MSASVKSLPVTQHRLAALPGRQAVEAQDGLVHALAAQRDVVDGERQRRGELVGARLDQDVVAGLRLEQRRENVILRSGAWIDLDVASLAEHDRRQCVVRAVDRGQILGRRPAIRSRDRS